MQLITLIDITFIINNLFDYSLILNMIEMLVLFLIIYHNFCIIFQVIWLTQIQSQENV